MRQHTCRSIGNLRSGLALLLAAATPAAATDGVKLLKQPSAFPIVISTPGSYRLKSNLTVPDANTTAISITADNVTLDLNGFSILGPTVCSGSPVTSCAPTGTGSGIVGTGSNIAVRNGTVRGVGYRGIELMFTQGAVVDALRVRDNGSVGISLGDQCRAAGNTVTRNGSAGIIGGDECLMTGNVVLFNYGTGLHASEHSAMTGNLASHNGFEGIVVNGGTGVIVENVVADNGEEGIETAGGVVSRNTVEYNGADGIRTQNGITSENSVLATSGFNVGIYAGGAGLVLNNVVAGAGEVGLQLDTPTGYAGNVLDNNNGGNTNPQVSEGVEILPNLCGGDTTCP